MPIDATTNLARTDAPSGSLPVFNGMTARDVAICVVFVAVLFVASVLPFWNVWSVDLSAYYYAGHFYGTGQFDMIYAGPPDIIGPEMPPPWTNALAADGYGDETTYPFIYLPWVAVVMAPVAATFDVMAVMNAVQVINAALLTFAVLLAWHVIGRGRVSLKVWLVASLLMVLTSATSTLALHLGQIQILVYVAVLVAVERLQAGKPYQAAFALALAACLKITPAAFGILFLWNRAWGGMFAFIGLCLGFAAVNIAQIGWPLHAEYFELMAALNAQVFLSNIGVSMEGLLYQVAAFFEGAGLRFTENEYSFPKPVWQDIAVKLGFCFGLLSCWLVTRQLPARERIAFQALILAVLVPLMTPLGWVHYYLLASVLLPVFLAPGDRVAQTLFVAYVLVLNLVFFIYAGVLAWAFMPQMLVGVILFVAVLVWAHVVALRMPRASSRP